MPVFTSRGEPLALWVCPVADFAGVARHIFDAARTGLPGWRMAVAAPEGHLLERLRGLDVEVVPLAMTSTQGAVSSLRRTLKSLRPTVAHSHLAKADILLAAASIGLPVTLVTTEHHISPDRYMFHPSRIGAQSMEIVHSARLTRFAAAMAVSESTRRDMVSRWRPRLPITVILNGVDRPTTVPLRSPGLRMLSLSRLSPEKNVAMTLRAFSLVSHRYPEATLTVAGIGPDEAALRELAKGLGITRAVRFVGFIDAERAVLEHDVLLQPSRSDNCSYSLLDAMAYGIGVAASPVGGNPEILPDRCIAALDDDERLAQIAIAQGLEVAVRPRLTDSIPTVPEMAELITHVYDRTGWQNRRQFAARKSDP